MGPAHVPVPGVTPSPCARDRLSALLGVTSRGPGGLEAVVPSPWANPWGVAYGGYAAAVAALALEGACPPGQDLVQLHVTFLRGVGLDRLAVEVAPVRAGRTTAELAATLVQGGRPVARAGARSAVPADGPTWSAPRPPAPPPEACPPRPDVPGMGTRPAFMGTDIEVRQVPSGPLAGGHGYREWIRLPALPVGPDPQPVAALALLSDLGGAAAFGLAATLTGRPATVASLDLTLHVVRPPAAGWLLAEVLPVTAARGLVTSGATYWDEQGACARVAQVALLRPRPAGPGVDERPGDGHPGDQTDRSVGRPGRAEEGAHP